MTTERADQRSGSSGRATWPASTAMRSTTQVPDGRLDGHRARHARRRRWPRSTGSTPSRPPRRSSAATDVDVVVIATPHSTHLPLALAAAAAGKHVYLEKPMALDVAECDQIIDACRATGVQLTIAKQTRHMEMSMRAKAFIDEGRIGRILFLRPMSVTPGRRLRQRARRAGRPIRARATPSSTGAPTPATPSAGSPAPRPSAPTPTTTTSPGLPLENPTVMVQFRLSNGSIAQVLMSYEIGPSGFGTRRNNQYQIVGTEGSIFWDLDRLDLVTGDRDVADLGAAELDAPRLQATRPATGRQHRPPDRRLHRVAARRRATDDHRRGRPGRDRDDPGREAVRPDRAGRRPAAGRRRAGLTVKITDVRTMLLLGPDPHGVGGLERSWHVLLVRIDTDAGVYGLGEAGNFFGDRAGDRLRARVADRPRPAGDPPVRPGDAVGRPAAVRARR